MATRTRTRRRKHTIARPDDRTLFVLSALEHAASVAGRAGALAAPPDVVVDWGAAIRAAWNRLDARERVIRRQVLEAYRVEANRLDQRLDAEDALAFLDG